MNVPTWARLALLTIGAVISGLLLSRLEDEAAVEPDMPTLGAGYYLDDAELTGTGDDGRILYQVRTRRATEALNDGGVDLEDVHVSYSARDDIPWILTAATGRIPPGGKMLELTGDVVAITSEDGREPATIRTDYLALDPEKFVAQTESKVEIEYSGNRVFATGMRVFLKEDRVQLISNVNGKFLP